MKAGLLAVAAVALLAVPYQPAAADDCLSVSMTVTASFPNDPGFEGLYKYCVSGSWDVGQSPALSHIDFFVGLEACECLCTAGIIQFDSPAGSSNGDPDPCTVDYDGEYLCMGDPTAPPEMQTASVKFEYPSGQGCEPSTSGTGTWCFYSQLPPGNSMTHEDGVLIKYGGGTCTGDLVGQLPICQCQTENHRHSWGKVKSVYR